MASDFFSKAQTSKKEFVEIKPDMIYEDAVMLIHSHILNLDL